MFDDGKSEGLKSGEEPPLDPPATAVGGETDWEGFYPRRGWCAVGLALSEGDPVRYQAALRMPIEKALALLVYRKRMIDDCRLAIEEGGGGQGCPPHGGEGETVTVRGNNRTVVRRERW